MKKYFVAVALVFVLVFTIAGTVLAEDKIEQCDKSKGECFNCHGKTDYSVTKASEKFSLFVEEKRFKSSVHGVFECKVCHGDGNEEHLYGKPLEERISGQCANCHTGEAFDYSRSIHNSHKKNQPNCVNCHGGHYIDGINEKGSLVSGGNIAATCADKCHQTEGKEFTESFHGKAVALGSMDAPSCVTCHGAHRILSKNNPAASANIKNKPSLCARCHEGYNLGVGVAEHYEVKSSGYGRPMYHIKTKMVWLIIAVMTVFLVHVILDLIQRIRRNTKARRH